MYETCVCLFSSVVELVSKQHLKKGKIHGSFTEWSNPALTKLVRHRNFVCGFSFWYFLSSLV